MPRREQCDGKDPCDRCSRSGRQCLFSSNQHESKDALRAEIERLRGNNERSNALLDVVSSPNNLGMLNMMVQRLHDNRTDSRHAILLDFAARIRTGSLERRPASSDLPASDPCPYLNNTMGEAGGGKSPSLPGLLSTSSPTPSPKPPPKTEPMQTGWDVAHVRQLVESLAKWDCMPFCLLNKKLFLDDLASGGTRYCSPALVNALVALSMRMKEGSNDEALSGKTLSLIRDSSGRLPDGQALGVLALYQLVCGREADARDLASSFVTAMSQLRTQKPSLDEDDSYDGHQYNQVISASYCGAISLVRELRMFQLLEWVYKILAYGHEGISWSRVLAALSESYAGIYGLSHASPLVAHFVFASGKFSLAAEKTGHGVMNIVSMRASSTGVDKKALASSSPSSSPSHVFMSMVAHARLLLDEMSETHPMAAVAESSLSLYPVELQFMGFAHSLPSDVKVVDRPTSLSLE
ncbi:hypothetical protein L249_8759 [Ophiocordyceps polyrhachis-furcata BCC 54312]|uniref:Zn(2)-C6 fungal-type domain-containing protein n=1 Tax=Ophiocordyceps polyrhachis-furcata BCC 54312 TaxID=1330021 RepID=A0A367L6L8_9HYPO|nr:hypothetical protein L249_8759 [Ophiocordyceps polyrhachis-furcata BCC 54312]